MEIIPLFLILLSLPLASWANEILTYTPGASSEDQEFGDSGVFKSNIIIPYLGTSGEPVLSIDVAIPENKLASFEAFLNLADADQHTSVSRPEFVGSFMQMASSSPSVRHMTVRFGIGDKIKQFSLKENEHVPVCLTRPASQDVPIIIKGMSIGVET